MARVIRGGLRLQTPRHVLHHSSLSPSSIGDDSETTSSSSSSESESEIDLPTLQAPEPIGRTSQRFGRQTSDMLSAAKMPAQRRLDEMAQEQDSASPRRAKHRRHRHSSRQNTEDSRPMRTVYVQRNADRDVDDRWTPPASARSVPHDRHPPKSSQDYGSSSRSRHHHRRNHSTQETSSMSYAERERRRSRRAYGEDEMYTQRMPPPRTYDERPIPSLQRSKSGSYRRSSWFQPIIERRPLAPQTSRPPPKRTYSLTTPPRIAPLDRSQSTKAPRVGDMETGSVATTSRRSASTGLFGGIFARPPPRQPMKRVECITCLSDDVPASRAARLNCGHIMCHDCLKRIFELSVNDPQHMPPRCCTPEHIPLKHVDRLFSDRFKITWNRKYQEYTTKNRIYCPTRGCGEWIKPSNIHVENGRKWHVRRECPNDEETNRLVETAKQEGWQRCFNCRAMVELKEGCNHMTCRCRAEFCMICGSKWKTCNCPWFNYDNAVTNAGHDRGDVLNHMVPLDAAPIHHRAPLDGPAQLNYEQELAARRRQEASDEVLARRLQTLGISDGFDNLAAREIITGPYSPEQAAADAMGEGVWSTWTASGPRRSRSNRRMDPPLREHGVAEREYNSDPRLRVSERVVPARVTRDYMSEAAAHAPEPMKLSEIAGVTRGPRQGRVDAWLTHVEAGIAA
ncbi:MAG: hypothetical protein M1814_000076 [Vezdaea aestivalis]|nr:MAG: hypothetical protein M1814_000076 [Vezdaea aestivalis]